MGALRGMGRGIASVAGVTLFALACSSGGSAGTGIGSDGGGGGGGGGGSCATTPLSFELHTTGGATFCDGSGCGGRFLSIERADKTPVTIDASCIADCSDCQPIACTASCESAQPIGAAGAKATWNGRTYGKSTCGGGTQCAAAGCAEAGTYVAHMCGWRASGDAGTAPVCTSGASTPDCVDVTFTWPPADPAAVVSGTIGP